MTLAFLQFRVLLLALLWLAGPVFAASKPGKTPKKNTKDEVVTITTAQGVIRLVLFDDTPLHKANFLQKAKSGFYDGTSFHRVIDNFMIQGGDANSKDDDPSSSSQFYLVENHDGTHFLDGQYTVFGQVIQGLEVIDKIAKLPKDERDHPVAKAKMTMKVEKLKRKKISKLYGYTFNN